MLPPVALWLLERELVVMLLMSSAPLDMRWLVRGTVALTGLFASNPTSRVDGFPTPHSCSTRGLL